MKQGVLIERNNSKNLLISFGGFKQGLGMPVFEFYNSFSSVTCDKIFIKDDNKAWYHKGIDEDLYSINLIYKYIKGVISEGDYEKVCFVGNSMGGYAAILFGVLLNVDEILVFSPQTFINKWSRFIYKDKRWGIQMNEIYKYKNRSVEYFDLKRFLKRNKYYSGKLSLYYSINDKLDKIHAERLKNINFVELFPIDFGGHNIVRELKKTGDLNKILSKLYN